MEKVGLYLKKYVFPSIILIFGLFLLKEGLSANKSNISQTPTFIFGSIIICILSIIIFLYISKIISKKLHISILVSLLLVLLSGFLWTSKESYKSVISTINHIENKKSRQEKIKQRLRDIEKLQIAYKKKYKWYASSFEKLEKFLLNDSISTEITYGSVPDGRINKNDCDKLGYDPSNTEDAIKIESYSEEEAFSLGYITKETEWKSVEEELFSENPNKDDEKELRKYKFYADSISYVPTVSTEKNRRFKLSADFLEDETGDSLFFILTNKFQKNHFVSSSLIDHSETFKDYYKRNIKGLIVNDDIPFFKNILYQDIIVSANNKKTSNINDLQNIISESLNNNNDTLKIQLVREGVSINKVLPIFENIFQKNDEIIYLLESEETFETIQIIDTNIISKHLLEEKITPEHAKILGYDTIVNKEQMEAYDSIEAVKCGIFKVIDSLRIIETSTVNKKILSSERFYTIFNEKDSLNRLEEKKIKKIKKEIEVYNETSKLINWKNNKISTFPDSSTVSDFKKLTESIKHQKEIELKEKIANLESKKISFLINRKDSIFKVDFSYHEMKEFSKENTQNKSILQNKFLECISANLYNPSKKENTISYYYNIKNIFPSNSSKLIENIKTQISKNTSPILLNPLDFLKINIPDKVLKKETKVVDLNKFIDYYLENDMDTTLISFEHEKDKFLNVKNNDDESFLIPYSKKGFPVFEAIDPDPYDPLFEKDTLKTGSLTKVMTNGNWK